MDLARISTCTYPVRTENLDYSFALIRDAGYGNVDLWGGLPNYSNDPDECDVAALKAKAAEYGLLIANLGTYPGRKLLDVGYYTEMLEMTRAINNAAFLGSRSIRVCPGHGEDPSIIPELIPFFREAAVCAQAKGIFLGMENHKGSIAGDPEAIMRLVRAVDSPFFGILYEPANLTHCGVDYQTAYDLFRGWVTHVHVKDWHHVDGTYERTMLGQGKLDTRWLVDTLEADGYSGHYALEFEIEKVVPIEEGLPQWLATFREL